MIEWTQTERGFRLGSFRDRYGDRCSIQASSLATEECIWLGRQEILGEPTRMHLTREMAAELGHILLNFSQTGELP